MTIQHGDGPGKLQVEMEEPSLPNCLSKEEFPIFRSQRPIAEKVWLHDQIQVLLQAQSKAENLLHFFQFSTQKRLFAPTHL